MRSPRFFLACLLTSLASLTGVPSLAQITPDTTMGAESSVVVPDATVRGDLADLIEGGSARGPNLFHSFSDFNVLAAERVYFANPAGIESILSRVTGDRTSDLFGTLGVDGTADLIFFNPNGIVFGSEATLDITGSFHATTAKSSSLGETLFGEAPDVQSQPLIINPNTSFENYLTSNSGDIVQRGQISAGEELSLVANNLDLEGSITAGRNLSLIANDTVTIRDTVDSPFVAIATGDLLVQGNDKIDIFALNHSDSGLFSNQDMTLRSAAPVGGDAHYFSGGNFRIETLAGTAGSLYSPNDPIIFADGDITLDSYTGASLHLLAGGSVIAPFITITGTEAPETSFNQEVILSDGSTLVIDGSAKPTLDIRAGIDWRQILAEQPIDLPGNLILGNLTLEPESFGNSATSSAIVLNDISMPVPDSVVFLTNQFVRNPNLPNGDIVVLGGIDASGNGGSGSSITIDANQDFVLLPLLGEGVITASSDTSNAGDITFLAQESVRLVGPSSESTVNVISNLAPGAVGDTGKITISADNLVLANAQISNSLFGSGSTGLIDVTVADSISLENSQVLSTIGAGGVGSSRGIKLEASGNLSLLDGSQILTIVRSALGALPAGEGSAGEININVTGDIDVVGRLVAAPASGRFRGEGGIASAIAPGASGSAGKIEITANDLSLSEFASVRSAIDEGAEGEAGEVILQLNNLRLFDQAQIVTATEGKGNAGNINIDVAQRMSLADRSIITSGVLFGAQGEAAVIDIDAGTLSIESGSGVVGSVLESIDGSSAGIGNAGDIIIKVRENLLVEGQQADISSRISTNLGRGTQGNGGNIAITAGTIAVGNTASITSGTESEGRAGNVQLDTDQLSVFDDGGIQTSTFGQGDAGNIQLDANHLVVSNGGFFLADAFSNSSGRGGNIIIDATNSVEILGVSATDVDANGVPDSSGLYAQARGTGNAGEIKLTTGRLTIADGGTISTETSGGGNGGNLRVYADAIKVTGGSPEQSFSSGISADAESNSSGNAGDVDINSRQLTLRNGGFISSSAKPNSQGNTGDVRVNVTESIEVLGTTLDGDNATAISIGVGPGASGNSANLSIDTDRLMLRNGGSVLAQNFGTGEGGSLNITARESLEVSSGNGAISLVNATIGPTATGQSSNIDLQTRHLTLQNGGQVVTSTFGTVDAGDINVVATDTIDIQGISPNGQFPSGVLATSIPFSLVLGLPDGEQAFGTMAGDGGDITLKTRSLNISAQGEVSSRTFGASDAGNVRLLVDDLNMWNGEISTTSEQGFGGGIQISGDNIRLFQDSDITTFVASGEGSGGNINIDADSVVALDDSDILAFSADGRGGNIDFGETAYFGESFSGSPLNDDFQDLDGNSRTDVNATGLISSGTITIPDVSFIENSLSELSEKLVDADTLVVSSCIARGGDSNGTFTFSGSDRTPQSPTAEGPSNYSIGTVQPIPDNAEDANTAAIAEPQAVYRLADGRLVMGRDCQSP